MRRELARDKLLGERGEGFVPFLGSRFLLCSFPLCSGVKEGKVFFFLKKKSNYWMENRRSMEVVMSGRRRVIGSVASDVRFLSLHNVTNAHVIRFV